MRKPWMEIKCILIAASDIREIIFFYLWFIYSNAESEATSRINNVSVT
jgi:hypothetical protein